MSLFHRWRAGECALLASFAAACAPTEITPTQLLVNVYADPIVATKLRQVRAAFYEVDATDAAKPAGELPFVLPLRTDEPADVTALLSFGVARGEQERFKLVVTGYDSTESDALPAIEQKAIVSFRNHQKLSLQMLLGAGCFKPEMLCRGLETTCSLTSISADGAGACDDVPVLVGTTVDEPLPVLASSDAAVPSTDSSTLPSSADDASGGGSADASLGRDDTDGQATSVSSDASAMTGQVSSFSGADAVYTLTVHDPNDSANPVRVAANSAGNASVVFDAPWGADTAQAIALRVRTAHPEAIAMWTWYDNTTNRVITSGGGAFQETPTLPANVAIQLPSGTQSMRVELTYNNTSDSAIADSTSFDFGVVQGAKLRPVYAATTQSLVAFNIRVPANSQDTEATGSCKATTTAPVYLLSAAPHAHAFARHVHFALKKANGNERVMLDAPFSQAAIALYPLEPPQLLETGDVITTTCTFDNPTNLAVNYGENPRTNEMCFNFAMYYPAGAFSCGL